jgi:hypothetical protein
MYTANENAIVTPNSEKQEPLKIEPPLAKLRSVTVFFIRNLINSVMSAQKKL